MKKFDRVSWAIVAITFIAIVISLFMTIKVHPGDPGEDVPPNTPDMPSYSNGGGIYATMEYLFDVKTPGEYFVEVKAHPKAKFPKIQGGYSETNVHCFIRLRGVSVPRAMHSSNDRARPHAYVERERARFNMGVDYVWSLVKLNKTLKLYNPKVVEDDKVVECDIEFLLGNEWVNLAAVMLHDEHARPGDNDWDWGSRNVTLVSQAVPK